MAWNEDLPRPEQELHPPTMEWEEKLPQDEFAGWKPPQAEPERKKSRRLLASAVLLAAMLGLLATTLPKTEPVTVPAVLVESKPTAASVATPVPTAVPTATPEAILQEEPGCEVLFVAFSDVLRAKLHMADVEHLEEVTIELWDVARESLEQQWTVAAAELENGSYDVPDMPAVYEIHMAHGETEPYPEPELRVMARYRTDTGEPVIEKVLQPSEEQGWYVRDGEGILLVRTFESDTPVSFQVGSQAPVAPDELMVQLRLNGRLLTEGEYRASTTKEAYFWNPGQEFYFGIVEIPKPAGEGTLEVTVTQLLRDGTSIWSDTKVLSYQAS